MVFKKRQQRSGRGRSVKAILFIIIAFAIMSSGLDSCNFTGFSDIASIFQGNAPMAQQKAEARLSRVAEDIQSLEEPVRRRANIEIKKTNLFDTLPEIDQFPLVVSPRRGAGRVSVEVFASTEKSGTNTDGWLVEVAQDFNRQQYRLDSGAVAQVQIRKIASGTGAQFIAAGKNRPQGFTPSNDLWISFVAAHGVKVRKVRDRLVGNAGGIVMRKSSADSLRSEYTDLSVKNIIDAVIKDKLVTGYTNPYASSTGLNFLVTVLHAFGGSTDEAMLREDVVSAFESFQRNVPFVAMTTLQMRDSVQRNGSLDAFVMEWQTFVNTSPALSKSYEFIPFGIRHDNPLYAVGDVSDEEFQVLELLAEHAEKPQFKKLADRFGFNQMDEYQSAYKVPSGNTLLGAQSTWKQNKDAGRPIVAIFLADVSGSMDGFRLNALKNALVTGSEFISENNEIGLVTFSDRVRILLQPKRFDLLQKSAFWAAVQDLSAGGKTAMYDGITVGLEMLAERRRANPDAKYMLFVLTDGETNRGVSYADLSRVIEGVRIPIYTIGYAEQIDQLKALSGLVEAASINASEGDVAYKIGNLLNAQM